MGESVGHGDGQLGEVGGWVFRGGGQYSVFFLPYVNPSTSAL